MNRDSLQQVAHFILGGAALDDANMTSIEVDVSRFSAVTIACGVGTTDGGSDPTVFSVHISDTATFSPGAGNLVGTATVFPSAANQVTLIDIPDIDRRGKFLEVIVTAGNGGGVSAITCYGIGILKGNCLGTAADRGAVGVLVVEPS
jgi:hypothetical protein